MTVSRYLWAQAVGAFLLLPGVVAFVVRILMVEESWAARTFGEDWTRYQSRVPRWLGRVR